MDYRSASLIIRASFRDKNNEGYSRTQLTLQIFNLKTRIWEPLVTNMRAANGMLHMELQLGEWTQSSNNTQQMFVSWLSQDALPAFRLVQYIEDRPEVELIYSGGLMTSYNGEKLELNFGEMWVMDEETISNHKEELPDGVNVVHIANPIPGENSDMYGGLWASIGQPTSFRGYNGKDHIVSFATQDEIDQIAQEKQALQQSVASLQSQVQQRDATILEKENEISQLEQDVSDKSLEVANLEQDLLTAQQQVGKVSTQSAPLQEVYSKVVTEVDAAKAQMDTSNFALTNVSLNLKTHVKSNGDQFELQLVDAESTEHVNGAAVSNLTIDLVTKPVDSAINAIAIPKLIGLTETVTRKKLAQSGQKLKAVYQVFKGKVPGQAVLQTPEAGEDANAENVVTVIFAKNKK